MSTPPFPPPNTPPPPPPPGGGNPYGNNPNPYGNNPNPYGNNPYGNNPPYGGNPYQNQNPMGMQRDLPNATAILVLGIVSIVTCFCYGLPGLGTGIAALIMGNKATREYEANPSQYTTQSYNNVKAGRICAIIGTILSGLFILYLIWWFAILGMGMSGIYGRQW